MLRILGIALAVLIGLAYLFYLLLTNWMDGGAAAATTAVLFIALLWFVAARIRRAVAASSAYLGDVFRRRR